MTRSLAVTLMVGGLLCANAARSSADTITFDNSATHPGGLMTVGNTVSLTLGVIDAVARTQPAVPFLFQNISGLCGPGGVFGCLTITTGAFNGPDTSTLNVNDYKYLSAGSSISIVGSVAALGLGPGTVLFSAAFDGDVTLTFDDICQTQPTQCTGSLTGTLAPGEINPLLAFALGVPKTTLGGNDQNLFVSFAGISLPQSGPPSGSAMANTNQLQVITPSLVPNPLGEVPEPGTLILFGTGLVIAARMTRRRLQS